MPWLQPMTGKRPGVWFSWKELQVTSTGIRNVAPADARLNLRLLVHHCLDPLRVHLERPVHVTSGYRCHAVNDAVGGSVRSFHTKGLAADIKVKGLTAHDIMRAVIDSDIQFDQAIAYHANRGGHLHLGFSVGRLRSQRLWARKSGGYEVYDDDLA